MIKGLPDDIQNKLRLSHIPINTYETLRLDKFQANNDNRLAVDTIAELLSQKLEKPLILFVGAPGLGKTHLAVSLGWERILQNKTVLYWQVSELLDALREGYRIEDRLRIGENSNETYTTIMACCKNFHTLILDDMGYQKNTEWVAERLDSLVDKRYMDGRETIITSNTSQIPDRILDRCRDGRIVMLKGQSYRGRK